MHYTGLHCTVLDFVALHRTDMEFTALHSIALHSNNSLAAKLALKFMTGYAPVGGNCGGGGSKAMTDVAINYLETIVSHSKTRNQTNAERSYETGLAKTNTHSCPLALPLLLLSDI